MTNYEYLKEIDPNHAQQVYLEDWAASAEAEDEWGWSPSPRPLARVTTAQLTTKLRTYEKLVKEVSDLHNRGIPPLPWRSYENIAVIYHEIAMEAVVRNIRLTSLTKLENDFVATCIVSFYRD